MPRRHLGLQRELHLAHAAQTAPAPTNVTQRAKNVTSERVRVGREATLCNIFSMSCGFRTNARGVPTSKMPFPLNIRGRTPQRCHVALTGPLSGPDRGCHRNVTALNIGGMRAFGWVVMGAFFLGAVGCATTAEADVATEDKTDRRAICRSAPVAVGTAINTKRRRQNTCTTYANARVVTADELRLSGVPLTGDALRRRLPILSRR